MIVMIKNDFIKDHKNRNNLRSKISPFWFGGQLEEALLVIFDNVIMER